MWQIPLITCYSPHISRKGGRCVTTVFVAVAYYLNLLYIIDHSAVGFNEILDIIAEVVVGIYACATISLRLLVYLECKLFADVIGRGQGNGCSLVCTVVVVIYVEYEFALFLVEIIYLFLLAEAHIKVARGFHRHLHHASG